MTGRRCAYCGGACYGVTCSSCADLRRIERAAVAIPKPRAPRAKRAPQFLATCPRCGTQARGLHCPDCRMLMYLPKSDPMYSMPRMSDELREAVQATKGTEA